MKTEQTKQVKGWLRRYGKKYANDDLGFNTDQMCDDCCYDLDLRDYHKQVLPMIIRWVNEYQQ